MEWWKEMKNVTVDQVTLLFAKWLILVASQETALS
jgi:hypothetical protein